MSVGITADKVIFITPPPLNEAAWQKECELAGSPLNRLNSVAGQYAQACVQAAGQCGADILDLWTLMQKDGQVRSSHVPNKPLLVCMLQGVMDTTNTLDILCGTTPLNIQDVIVIYTNLESVIIE